MSGENTILVYTDRNQNAAVRILEQKEA